MAVRKKIKSGKIKRHKFRKAIYERRTDVDKANGETRSAFGLKQGFGKPFSAHSIPFRVEFSWENPDGSEENFQTHWIDCRKFFGEEKGFLEAHYSQHKEEWSDRETLESKFVAVYCAGWLVENKDKYHFNQCFIFPTTKIHNETIRMPIYQIKWSENLAKNSVFGTNLAIVMKNAIWHRKSLHG